MGWNDGSRMSGDDEAGIMDLGNVDRVMGWHEGLGWWSLV